MSMYEADGIAWTQETVERSEKILQILGENMRKPVLQCAMKRECYGPPEVCNICNPDNWSK